MSQSDTHPTYTDTVCQLYVHGGLHKVLTLPATVCNTGIFGILFCVRDPSRHSVKTYLCVRVVSPKKFLTS